MFSFSSRHPVPAESDKRRAILVVCTANICRSPMAEVALRKRLWQSGLDFDVDSAATHEYMVGMPPYTLAVATAKRRGYNITGIVARRVRPHDFHYFDLVLGMCRANIDWLKAFAPERSRRKIRLLTEYSSEYRRQDVPDPYAGGVADFEIALDMIEDACRGVAKSFAEASAIAS
jgi:protein-tyrosine phosphatase